MDALRALRTEPIDTITTRLSNLLDGSIQDDDGSLLAEVWQNLEEDFEHSRTHRWMTKSTQAQQDKALSEYRQWVSAYLSDSNENIVIPDV